MKKHVLWLGPLIALFGFFSYFFVFVQWSATRNFPWFNLPLLVLAVFLSVYGLYHAWSGGLGRKIAGISSATLSLLLAGFFSWYIFSFSYGVPDRAQAAGMGTALPDFVLVSEAGEEVNIREAASDQLILVFFRGYW